MTELNIPEQLKTNMHYFNLNNQLKYDLEQQNIIKMQQLEAIRLMQISLEKLTATTTVPLHNQTTRAASKLAGNTPPPPTILVYKETSLHKNLLVSKMLNKAKYFYYQSIVQTMRMSLMSKLNYYSSLIQQLYPNDMNASKLNNLNTDHFPKKNNSDETSLINEMKVLMQQILHDTYQFNCFSNSNINSSSNANLNVSPLVDLSNLTEKTVTPQKVLKECSPSDLNKPSNEKKTQERTEESTSSDSPVSNQNGDGDCDDQFKRIKQLNDVKHSLYSLLFAQSEEDSSRTETKTETELKSGVLQQLNKSNSQNENISKRKSSEDRVQGSAKRAKSTNKIYCSIDTNNNHVILGDDTNKKKQEAKPTNDTNINNNNKNKNNYNDDQQQQVARKQRANGSATKPHISTKLLKMSLKTATKKQSESNLVNKHGQTKFNLESESFINLEVLV